VVSCHTLPVTEHHSARARRCPNILLGDRGTTHSPVCVWTTCPAASLRTNTSCRNLTLNLPQQNESWNKHRKVETAWGVEQNFSLSRLSFACSMKCERVTGGRQTYREVICLPVILSHTFWRPVTKFGSIIHRVRRKAFTGSTAPLNPCPRGLNRSRAGRNLLSVFCARRYA